MEPMKLSEIDQFKSDVVDVAKGAGLVIGMTFVLISIVAIPFGFLVLLCSLLS